MKIAILDKVHPVIMDTLTQHNALIDLHYNTPLEEFKTIVHKYDGIVLRSRLKMDKALLSLAKNLKFIGRPGAGLENIDLDFCNHHNIKVFRSPEGNMDAVGEHTLGMLLSLFNNINRSAIEIKEGNWLREENRGIELKTKTVGILGYGFMGKTFSKKLKGFGVNVIAYDKYKTNYSSEYVKEVSLEEFFKQTDILSIHTPLTSETIRMVDSRFIEQFKNNIFIINTARGKTLVTEDLVEQMKAKKVLGACLDVLEYENSSFEFLTNVNIPAPLSYLLNSNNALITPHIAGWTHEAKYKMGKILIDKIIASIFC